MTDDLQQPHVHKHVESRTTSTSVSESTLTDLLYCRIRLIGEIMRSGDVVLIGDTFTSLGFTGNCGAYYAGQIVTNSMTGKVITKAI